MGQKLHGTGFGTDFVHTKHSQQKQLTNCTQETLPGAGDLAQVEATFDPQHQKKKHYQQCKCNTQNRRKCLKIIYLIWDINPEYIKS